MYPISKDCSLLSASSAQHIPRILQSGCLSFWLAGVIAGNQSPLLSQLPLSDRDWLVSPSLWNSKKWVYVASCALSLLLALTAICRQRVCEPFHVCYRLPCMNESMQPPQYSPVPLPLCAHTYGVLVKPCFVRGFTCMLTCAMWNDFQYSTPLWWLIHSFILHSCTSPPLLTVLLLFPPYLHTFYPPCRPQRPLHLVK